MTFGLLFAGCCDVLCTCSDCSYYKTTTGVVGEGKILNLGRDLGGIENPITIDFGTKSWTVYHQDNLKWPHLKFCTLVAEDILCLE